MELRDYFTSQKSVRLDPVHKVELYETITQRTHAHVSIFARMSFYTKLALYTFVGMVFLASLYIPYFSSHFRNTDGILTTNPGGATVQADYIAQIIETKWDISIYNNGKKVESTLFRAGDRLVLPAGAEIVFHVTTIAQAKVIGPAEFTIEKSEQGYTIQLVNGQYAEIQSLKGTDVNASTQESVGLRSSRVSITPKNSSKVHFTYKEEGQKATIDNDGDGALVVTKTDDTDNHEVLAEHSSAELGSGASVLDSITTGSRLTPSQVVQALKSPQQKETKKMVSGEQHETIKAILASEFLANDLQNVTAAYLKGRARDYEIAFVNLYNKVNQIYTVMELPVPQEVIDGRGTISLRILIKMTENLLYEMDANYYVAQSHQARLKKVLGWLYALREQAFGSQQDSTLSDTGLVGTLDLSDYKELLGN